MLWKDPHLARVKLSVYKTVLLATLVDEGEVSAASQVLIRPLEVFHMKRLRRFCMIS